jgi:hypothetical protein
MTIQPCIIYDKEFPEKAARIEEVIRSFKLPVGKMRHTDRREPLVHSDINIHVGVPVYSAIGWAHVNIFIRDDGLWNEEAFQPYMSAFDAIVRLQDVGDEMRDGFKAMIELVSVKKPKGTFHCPPILHSERCPEISIVTPTYNRRELIDIAFHNILSTDYPRERIEWVIIEDNEDSTKMASDKIMNFQMNCPDVKIKYIPIQGKMTIGQKRNIGVENATHGIVLFMDDDDHYPVTSFRRRVAWLLNGWNKNALISCCTTIALYDLKRGVSAVNVPPWNLPLGKRISEATLTFKKTAWLDRKFNEEVAVSEGDEWISGREDQVIEIIPQQIIVAFSHGENASGRRVPPTGAAVSCFWGFPKEYLVFVHRLAGVEIEEEKEKKSGAKAKNT